MDNGYVLKNSDGMYYTGYNNVSDQLRKATIYHSEKIVNDICKELNNNLKRLCGCSRTFKLVKVEIREVE